MTQPYNPSTTRPATRLALESILVACDGTHAGDGALTVARLLAARHSARVTVVGVLAPTVMSGPPESGMGAWLPDVEAARRAELLGAVRARAHDLGDPNWEVELATGNVAERIVDVAMAHRAGLIVMGIGRHAAVDRMLGSETMLQVMRCATMPVLAVPAATRTLPSRALVGMDFEPLGVSAAELTLEMLPALDSLAVAHVIAPRSAHEGLESSPSMNYTPVGHAFAEVTSRLTGRGPRVSTVLLEGGSPADRLIETASSLGADLVSVGTHQRGFVQRLMLGSVATRLVRHASCSVLVVPRRALGRTEGEVHAEAPVRAPATPPFGSHPEARLEARA